MQNFKINARRFIGKKKRMEVPGKLRDRVCSEKCEQCRIDGNENEAAGFCTECAEFMCHECFYHHLKSKFCRNHVLDSVSQEQNERNEESVTDYCTKHTNQLLRYYCRQHASVSCGDCIVDEHHGCHMEFVQDLAKDFKKSLDFINFMEEVKQIQFENETCDQENEAKRDQNTRLKEETVRKIEDFLKHVNENICEGGRELVAKVISLSNENETILSEVKEMISLVNNKSAEIRRTLDLNEDKNATLFIKYVELKPVLNELTKNISDIKRKNTIVSFSFQPDGRLEDFTRTHLNDLNVSGEDQTDNEMKDKAEIKGEQNMANFMTENAEHRHQMTGSVTTHPVQSNHGIEEGNERSTVTNYEECSKLKRSSVRQSMGSKEKTPPGRKGIILSVIPSDGRSTKSTLPKPEFWKSLFLRSEDIELGPKIGQGQISNVYIGEHRTKKITVAVKKCKEAFSEEQLKQHYLDGSIFQNYSHPNIEKLIGIAAQNTSLMLVMEYMPGGNLLQHLHEYGKEQPRFKAIHMCVDVASGMASLVEKGCIHTDLAARHCFVKDRDTVKISALGMTTNKTFSFAEDVPLPIKWTAPECLKTRTYTSASDVWSFGVLMWEIFSNGETPYFGWTNELVAHIVIQGYRMPAPPNTPSTVYQLMLACWENDPNSRITFAELHRRLTDIVSNPPEEDDWEFI